MLERPLESRFAAGAFVFPGGVVDEEDGADFWRGRLPEIPNLPDSGRASCTAAIRELFEETGILLADRPIEDVRAVAEARASLLSNDLRFEDVATRLGATFTRAPMAYFARWVTPRLFARRYDALFFLVALADREQEVTITDEHRSILWTLPGQALERFRSGELPMLFPTWKTLERLERYGSLEEAMVKFSSLEVELIEPLLEIHGGSVTPRLPGERVARLRPAGDREERPAPGIVSVTAENPGPLTLDGTRTWVIGTDVVAIVDPGPLDRDHLERIDAIVEGRHVTAVCLTHSHSDHAESAEEAAHRWGRLHASAGTLDRLGLDGRRLRDGDEIAVGQGRIMIALDTPGHSGDHLAYLCVPGRELLTGDLILGRGSSMVTHPDGSVGDHLASLARLASLRPAQLLPGHGPVVVDAGAKLAEYAEHRRARIRQVRSALAAAPSSLLQLRIAVYGDLSSGLCQAAELSLLAMLEYLRFLGEEVPPTLDPTSDC